MGNSCCPLLRKRNYRQIDNENNDHPLEELLSPIHRLDDEFLAKIFMYLNPDERIAIESGMNIILFLKFMKKT